MFASWKKELKAVCKERERERRGESYEPFKFDLIQLKVDNMPE